MKTIVRNDNAVALYLFDNNEVVDVKADKITIGDPVEMIITDCDSSNVTLFEGVTTPAEWTGGKYLYTTEDGWTLNPDWTPPEA
jgi:hypothetical protein